MKSEVTEATMEKIDYKQKLKHLYQPSAKEVVEVNAPPMNFLMIDGRGDPNTSKAFAEAVEALFAVSYTLKFMIKKGSSAIDYGVMPLEGQWWADDMSKFSTANKANWKWTAMIMQPPPVTKELIRKALVDIEHEEETQRTAEPPIRKTGRRYMRTDTPYRPLLRGRPDDRTRPSVHSLTGK